MLSFHVTAIIWTRSEQVYYLCYQGPSNAVHWSAYLCLSSALALFQLVSPAVAGRWVTLRLAPSFVCTAQETFFVGLSLSPYFALPTFCNFTFYKQLAGQCMKGVCVSNTSKFALLYNCHYYWWREMRQEDKIRYNTEWDDKINNGDEKGHYRQGFVTTINVVWTHW
jgi:hypothetical protein